jgi:hypothetical protein
MKELKLEIDRARRPVYTKKPSKEAAFYLDSSLLERFRAKVKAEGGGNYSAVIEGLMRLYLGEKLVKK